MNASNKWAQMEISHIVVHSILFFLVLNLRKKNAANWQILKTNKR